MTIENASSALERAANPQSLGDLELFAAISQDFAGSPALGETLANAIHQVMVYMETEAASIFLLDDSAEKLTCKACAGPVDIDGLTIGCDQGIVGRALTDNTVQMVRDVSLDGDFSSAVD